MVDTPEPGDRGNGCVELRLGPLDHLSVSVAIAPYVSTLSLLTDAFRGRSVGLSRDLAGAVREIARRVDPGPVRPMVVPGHSVAPDVVIPIVPREDIPASIHLEHLRAAPDSAVFDDLGATFGPDLPAHWRRVAERPSRWLHGYADAASRSWDLFHPLWERSEGLLSREIDRVAVASARRQHDVLFSGLSRKVRFANGSLFFPDSEPATYDRADILRTLERPVSMGKLAERLYYSPSTLTHHCHRLVRAGLVLRERRGRQIVLRRTDRGTSLLDVLSGD